MDIIIYLFRGMESNYEILPKRNGKTDGSFKKYHTTFMTNFYVIKIDDKKSKIFQYSFSLPEQIPQDSHLYDRSIRSIFQSLTQKIGYLAHKGQMIWGSIELKVPTTFNCQFQDQGKMYSLESLVKPTKQLNLKDLNQEKTKNIYLQILNIDLKNRLKSRHLCILDKKGQYFQDKIDGSESLDQMGLEVLTGFRITLSPLNSELFLQVDTCSRVLQARNLLEHFQGRFPKLDNQFQPLKVITKYGTFRTYQVEEIDFKKCPLSTFYNQKNQQQMTYIDYYKNVYGIKIEDTKQPLLKATKSIKKEIVNGGKQYKQVKETVYLVPELVSMIGLTDSQRKDHQVMRELSYFTKLSPGERVRKCAGIIEQLNKTDGLTLIKEQKRLQGYCLPPPQILFSGNTKIRPDNRGNIKHLGVLKDPAYFESWNFVYSVGVRKNQQDQRDNDQAIHAVIQLRKAGKAYGIQFDNPKFIKIKNGGLKDWKNQIRSDMKNKGTPQIYVVFLRRDQESIYGELKKFLTNQIKCPSQFVKRKNLSQKASLSVASKIAIQMNVKVGAAPWSVKNQHPDFQNKNIMYGALSISKNKQTLYTLGFVGTINSECTRVFSACKVGIKDKENISQDILEEIFVNWARNYYKTNKKTPDLILLYRQGLSVQQIKAQLPKMEIPALANTVKIIGEKTHTQNYNPQLMIVIANTRINNRYFVENQDNPGVNKKFTPQLLNPDSGSVMTEAMSTNNMQEFHLAAQYVTQGTCTPTMFRVAYNTTKNLSQEALIKFTFQQCFNYYNWVGAVRVPACLQSANKLSKLVGKYVKQDVVQSPVTLKHFFL